MAEAARNFGPIGSLVLTDSQQTGVGAPQSFD